MTDFTSFEFVMLAIIMSITLGFLGIVFWKGFTASSNRFRRLQAPRMISCLLCGRPNPVGPEEQECSRVVCRCGQPLYIVGFGSYPHPRTQ
ncbi:MAG: chloride channel protein [Armatimonadetes bacterium]|nr:chloride channel protein [Armatimonadota bacterium]